MSEENSSSQNAFQIHQGSYLNARLNKLLEDIDRYSVAPLQRDKATGELNFKLLIQSLSSVAISIYGEISKEEKKKIRHAIERMEQHNSKQIFKEYAGGMYKSDVRLEEKLWNEIKSDILDFRLFISELLEDYGLGLSFEKSAKQEMLE